MIIPPGTHPAGIPPTGKIILYKGQGRGLSLSLDQFSDGEDPVGYGPGNSAVETVPTPEKNIVLLPYFLKRSILNGF
jgi:hypothetical protein